MKMAASANVSLKTIFSSPLLVNDELELVDRPNPVPLDCTRMTTIRSTAITIWLINAAFFIASVIIPQMLTKS